MSTKTPHFYVPILLCRHYIQPETFLRKKSQYLNIQVTGFVFYPPEFDLIRPPPFKSATDKGIASNAPFNARIEPARLLLLQRASTDTEFPDLWEVPWGVCSLSDYTILHSVPRVMLETTGLHFRRFSKQIGNGEEVRCSEGLCFRLSFEIEVTEMMDSGKYIRCAALDDVHVVLDPEKHQDFVWATKEDIIQDIFPLAMPQQKDVVLQAFHRRKDAEERVRERAVHASRLRKQAWYEKVGRNRSAEDDEMEGEQGREDEEDYEDGEEQEEEYDEDSDGTLIGDGTVLDSGYPGIITGRS